MPQTVDLTEDLHTLVELASQPAALDDVLERALHSLRAALPYDLAALYELDGPTLKMRAAVGPLATPQLRSHDLPVARFPTVRRALELRQPLPLDAHDHNGEEGDPYDGVLDLPPGHSCMVVPLFAGGEDLGIITLDRQVCETYSQDAINLAGVYGQVVSIAIAFARQAEHLDRYRKQLERHNRLLLEEIGTTDTAIERLEASLSPSMRELARLARQVADADMPVLIRGETGTGKEVLAQAIHAWSRRANRPFVKLNCAAIPEHLVESELFGHVRGAFSGATRDRAGRFVTANHGTILLDEIGDMPSAVQGKLLRVLQEHTFEPVGSDRSVKVDVRVLAASHVDLEAAVKAGRFREDLYYRLAVFPLELPPLRQRSEDIPSIAQRTLDEMSRRTGRGPWSLSDAARDRLLAARWPGNVRELVNVLERATILQPGGVIDPSHLAPPARSHIALAAPQPTAALGDNPLPLREAERRHLIAALQRTGGKIYGRDGAAQLLDLKPTTLQSKLKKHGIDRLQVLQGGSSEAPPSSSTPTATLVSREYDPHSLPAQ
ncbi:MAG: sigma 54-interacting transcriptional regulator [Deltaproteobacteria bacterium]|nr:sigma 54-interacting transcriptional regulator [Deltaproteobacteria bacterium]